MKKITNLYGPPGTGKTTTCIETVKHWLGQGVDPGRIGYYSFTKVAAEEAKGRAITQTEYSSDDFSWFRTLHSAAYRLARVSQGGVADNREVAEFMKKAGFAYNPWATEIDDLQDTGVREGNILQALWDFGRNRRVSSAEEAWEVAPGDMRFRTDRENFRYYVEQFESWKKGKGLIDFTDMLMEAILGGEGTGCTHVVIDEAQDLTPLQWEMAALVEKNALVVVRAGDDDQCLYSWAGVLHKDYVNIEGDKRVLTQSYRVPGSVHREALSLIERNRDRVQKQYQPRDEEGGFNRRDTEIAPEIPEVGTVAFLFRNRKHLREKAEQLMDEKIPFASNRYSAPLSNRSVVRGMKALFRFRDRGKITIGELTDALEMIASTPSAGEYIPYGHRQRIQREAQSRPFTEITALGLTPEGDALLRQDPFLLADCAKGTRAGHLDYLQGLVRRYGVEVMSQPPRVTLTTVHGAKGTEFDHVFVAQDALRSAQDGLTENEEEENRAKYVAITRTKQSCTILPEMAEGGWII